jgi:hypothetical protein|tara:strand:+ start:9086 stop:9364 length:279 start_codon:yes stop_codon:yes gene_type:complete
LGTQATPEEIETYGVKLTKISTDAWEVVDEGEESLGWIWYRTVRSSVNGKAIFGGYGTGSKGSYMLLVKTTDEDLKVHQEDYWNWYRSISLH